MIKIPKCAFCKEEKEIGKEMFWCPRIRHYNPSGRSFYGKWTCLDCCRKKFFKNIFSINREGYASGHCDDCDFPIGAILRIKKIWGKPSSGPLQIVKNNPNDEYQVYPFHLFSRYYYNFEWRNNGLFLKPRLFCSGVSELVLVHKKLPTRKIILLEDTLTTWPLSWQELGRYYWSQCKYPQHFKVEKWMDDAPVIIAPLYLNEGGAEHDGNVKKAIEDIKEMYIKDRKGKPSRKTNFEE